MQQIFTPLFTILLKVVNNNSAILIFNGTIININFIVQTVTYLLRNCKKKGCTSRCTRTSLDDLLEVFRNRLNYKIQF